MERKIQVQPIPVPSTAPVSRVLEGKRGKLTTTLSDRQAMAVCQAQTSGFAFKLASDFATNKRLSSEQWWWVHKLAMDISGAANPTNPSAPRTQPLELASVLALFEKAGKHLKVPKIRLRTTGENPIGIRVFRAGSQSHAPGTLTVVSDGAYEDRIFFARIKLDGTLLKAKVCTDEIVELLTRFAANPQAVATEYGKVVNSCCFCGRTLEEEGSVEVGYGPICAGHFGLPHPQNGDTPSPQPEVISLPEKTPANPESTTVPASAQPTQATDPNAISQKRVLNSPSKRAAFKQACRIYERVAEGLYSPQEATSALQRAQDALSAANLENYCLQVMDAAGLPVKLYNQLKAGS